MSLNLSLLGQMLTFACFVIFTMKFVWPLITKAMQKREEEIADGLAAAERGQRDLELAKHKVTEMLRDAKLKAAQIADTATKRGVRIIEDAKEQARKEGERLLQIAKGDLEQEKLRAKADLQQEISAIVVAGAAKVLGSKIDEPANSDMINQLIAEVGGE